MDKKEYLSEEEIEEMLKEGLDFEDVIGEKFAFEIIGIKDQSNKWKVDGEAKFALTVNGVDWEENLVPVSTIDDDFDSALATTMLALASAINNPRILAKLRKRLNHTKYLGDESKEIQ